MSNYELKRKESVESLFKGGKTFRNCWPIWKPRIREILSTSENPIFDLGGELREIFFLTNTDSSRSNGQVSASGAAWEALVTWYLNLGFVNSNCVAFKKVSMLPDPIKKSFTVTYGSTKCNSESDITVVVFPNSFEGVDLSSNKASVRKRIINSHTQQFFEEFEIGIIQCKTNWNDNSQVPMAWNIIYKAKQFDTTEIGVGSEGYSIHDLNNFSYSFVTVPTQKDINAKFKETSAAVLRVRNLSGGNYWGLPGRNGIANSLGEIFNRNFANGFQGSFQETQRMVKKSLQKQDSLLSYFQI